MVRLLLVSALLTLVPSLTAQTTHNVPGSHATIQGAIDLAVGGDTVLVAPGTYLESIDFLGKAITVRSSGGSDVTIVDGQQAGVVVTFANGEGASSVLEGFTIRNGVVAGNLTPTPAMPIPVGDAGGVNVHGASPTIRDCRFTANEGRNATGGGIGGGGAIVCTGAAAPLIEACAFDANLGGVGFGSFLGVGLGGGGAITAVETSSPVVRRCTFTNNTGGEGGLDGGGGAISVHGTGVPVIEDCIFTSNQGGQGTVYGARLSGPGAIQISSCSPVVKRCTFDGNTASTGHAASQFADPGAGGAGAINVAAASTPLIEDCRFTNNTGAWGWGGGAGALSCYYAGAAPTVRNCVMSGNTGGNGANNDGWDAGGGAVNAMYGAAPVLVSCTLWSNVGGAGNEGGGGAINVSTATATLSHCILWANVGGSNGTPPSIQLHTPTASATVTWSDVAAGWPGTGNVDVDPTLLAGGVLAQGSPCIDAGDPLATNLAASDIDGDPRAFYDAPDMGADEYVSAGFYGSLLDANGEPERTLAVNGDTALLVDVGFAAVPTTVSVLQPSANPLPANFILFVSTAPPHEGAGFPLPAGIGTMCMALNDPTTLVVTSNFSTNFPGQLMPSTPAPWSFSFAVPFSLQVVLQAVTLRDAGQLAVTNGIDLRIP